MFGSFEALDAAMDEAARRKKMLQCCGTPPSKPVKRCLKKTPQSVAASVSTATPDAKRHMGEDSATKPTTSSESAATPEVSEPVVHAEAVVAVETVDATAVPWLIFLTSTPLPA